MSRSSSSSRASSTVLVVSAPKVLVVATPLLAERGGFFRGETWRFSLSGTLRRGLGRGTPKSERREGDGARGAGDEGRVLRVTGGKTGREATVALERREAADAAERRDAADRTLRRLSPDE